MAWTRRPGARLSRGIGAGLALLACVAVQGCSSVPDYANPAAWYRDLTGSSKDNQPPPERNSQNLAAGGAEPYPNLGTVPPPPDTAMSSIDRTKLREGLVADRANARYSDEALRSGRDVPPLPGEPLPGSVVQAAPGTPTAAQAAAASPPASPAASPDASSAVPPAGAAAPRHAVPQRGSEAAPQEASLVTPTVRSEPQGEVPHAPPPAPLGVATQQEAQANAPPPPAPPPVFTPVAPAAEPRVMSSPRGKAPSVTMAAAEIYFGAGGPISADDQQHLAEVARLFKQNGGTVRIVGYGRRGYGTDAAQQELSSFSQAIDHANAVAQALIKLGVPSNRITVQAAPATATGGVEDERAEVLLDY